MINKMQFIRFSSTLLLISAIIITSGCGTQQNVQTAAQKNTIQQEEKTFIQAAGKIKANDIRNIILDFSAIAQTVHVKEGQRVNLGEELITLDVHDIKQQITNKESDLNQAKLQLNISNNDLCTLEKELQQKNNEYNKENNNSVNLELKEKDYEYAKEVLNRAKNDLLRKQSLYEAATISKSELDIEQRKVDDAQKAADDKKLLLDDVTSNRQQTLEKLQLGINQQQSKINTLKFNIKIQEQKITNIESDIRQLKEKINKSYIKEEKIVSDIKNGIVQELSRISGDYIQANTKIFSLINMDSLVVEADVAEDFIKDVKVGSEVQILPIADGAKIYKGRVLKIADVGVDKNGETFITVQISIDDIDGYVKPNFNVDVKISK